MHIILSFLSFIDTCVDCPLGKELLWGGIRDILRSGCNDNSLEVRQKVCPINTIIIVSSPLVIMACLATVSYFQ